MWNLVFKSQIFLTTEVDGKTLLLKLGHTEGVIMSLPFSSVDANLAVLQSHVNCRRARVKPERRERHDV